MKFKQHLKDTFKGIYANNATKVSLFAKLLIQRIFGVPWWQLLISIALLIATVWLITWLSAKIYRTGILMYGKKASLKELWKWIR